MIGMSVTPTQQNARALTGMFGGVGRRVCVFCRLLGWVHGCSGKQNATVEAAMFSLEYPPPAGLSNSDMWIQEGFTKKDNVVK